MIRFLNRLQPWALALLRIVVGVAMLVHGWAIAVPAGGLRRAHPLAGVEAFTHRVVSLGLPYWLGYIAAGAVLFGGLCLVLGLLARFWALLIAGVLFVALFKVAIHHGYTGSEYPLALFAMSLLLCSTGSGALSLDRRFGIS